MPGDGVEVTVGEQENLLGSGDLGLYYFPDMAVLRLSSDPERLLVTASVSTWLVDGPSLTELTTATEVLTPGAAGAFDNGYVGISGVYRAANETLYSYYHGEDHEELPNIPDTEIPGYYARMGLAVADDEGESWTKLDPVVSSPQPKGWKWYDEQERGPR